ncbi:hypothetical protein [Pseudoramibacter faecis]|uniref:hypothetical protein n=1 Tax=Pseudoramibacter faecis TaxID=3108534 RepID=UPI002E76267A|nr:hypothetical protein [Pseudoramibacter sp. HA2172]
MYIKTEKFIENDESKSKEIDRVVKIVVGHIDRYTLFSVTGNGIQPDYRLNLSQYAVKMNKTASDTINFSIAEMAHKIVECIPSIQGIYISAKEI